MGRTNYAACMGDAHHWQHTGAPYYPLNKEAGTWPSGILARYIRASQRGVFVSRYTTKFRDILDGLANTIMAGEIKTYLGDRQVTTLPHKQASLRSATTHFRRLAAIQSVHIRIQLQQPSPVVRLGSALDRNNMNTISPNQELWWATWMGRNEPPSKPQGGCHVPWQTGRGIHHGFDRSR